MTNEFTISRTFDAPRDLVVKAYTDAESLRHWWGPAGLDIVHCTVDLKPGGLFHYSMRTPDGHEMWGKFVYKEINLPDSFVFISSFSDPTGATTRAPFNPNWPLEVSNKIIFSEDSGKTTISMKSAPINASDEEIAAFNGHFASMEQGFGATFDQLEKFLNSISK